jgi:putative flavoprotein involved in K+ transport
MRPRLDAVRIPGLLDGGGIPHTSGVTAIPGLYLLGAPWLRLRKSGIIWGAPADAQEIAAAIANP